MAGQNNEITSDILSTDFSVFQNAYCIEVDQDSAYEFGLSYRYNYYLPSESANSYQFMNHTVQKAGFKTEDGTSIDEVVLFMEVSDIDFFYRKLVERFGRPKTGSLSERYLNQHGYKIPEDFDNIDTDAYDSIPVPEIADYKLLRNVSWYGVNSEQNKVETNLMVLNPLKSQVMDVEIHDVQVVFRKADD